MMSVYWAYPTIVYSYFWQDTKRATIFSLAYLLLICSTVIWRDGFDGLTELRVFSAGVLTMAFMYFFSLVRDGYIEKLVQGNSDYKSYTEVLSGKVKSQFEEIRQSEEKFHGIANAAQDAVVMIDDNRKLTYWNPAAVLMFGYRTEEVLGRDFLDVIVPVRYHSLYQDALSKFQSTGSGYPAGLKGDQILLEARIIAVADAVEAISSHRPYRPALGIEAALKELRDNRGKFYDPVVVDACLKLFTEKTFSFEGRAGF